MKIFNSIVYNVIGKNNNSFVIAVIDLLLNTDTKY
jgi:hypothetical protein